MRASSGGTVRTPRFDKLPHWSLRKVNNIHQAVTAGFLHYNSTQKGFLHNRSSQQAWLGRTGIHFVIDKILAVDKNNS